jgi:hypothetical protein
MNRLLIRVATGLSTAALVASSFVGPALALDVEISGNGANSDNTANVAVSNSTTVNQSNVANISNDVDVDADTGRNDANGNTGGNVSIDTGDATANVGVSNTANSNVANVDGCCPNDVNVTISGNGAKSDNDAKVGVGNSTWVVQNNLALVKNDVDVDADSGKNDANRNTGGDVSITTGDAGTGNTGVVIANAVNKNVASVGNGSNGGSLAVVISGNGYDSDNTANVGVLSSVIVWQDNFASIRNDVDVDADSGKNDANANTGGDITIDTGDAVADVEISNLANFNAADVDSCGCILDGTVKIKNNGAKSDNDANVSLGDLTFVTQDNLYSCGHLPLGPNRGGKNSQKPCNDVDVDLDTGKNDANRNTDSDEPSVETGDATADILVETTANSNVVGDVDFDWGFPGLPNDNSNGSSVSLVLLWLLAQFS